MTENNKTNDYLYKSAIFMRDGLADVQKNINKLYQIVLLAIGLLLCLIALIGRSVIVEFIDWGVLWFSLIGLAGIYISLWLISFRNNDLQALGFLGISLSFLWLLLMAYGMGLGNPLHLGCYYDDETLKQYVCS